MFKQSNRLTSREFVHFFKSGTRYHGQVGQLVVAPYKQLKVAVVVPKKVVKTAVGRNRLRRQFYHTLAPLLKSSTGVFILVLKKDVLQLSPAERETAVIKLIGSIKKWFTLEYLGMWSFIWHSFFFDPVYNSLVFFIDIVPGGDVGLAIIFTVIVVKIVMLPLSIKATKTQQALKEIEPDLKNLKEKYKDDRERLAKEMMELYKTAGVNPFASIALMFVQIPIIIALYLSVSKGGGVPLPDINIQYLYPFIPTPENASMLFFGMLDITARSLPLAALAGIFQFIHVNLSMPKIAPRPEGEAPSMKDDFARSMNMQMRYVMPVLIFVFAYTISAAIALYFTVSSLMSILQEFVVRKHKTPPAASDV